MVYDKIAGFSGQSIFIFLGLMQSFHSQTSGSPEALIPKPLSIEKNEGIFTLQADTVLYVGEGLGAIGERLANDYLKPTTGFALPIKELSAAATPPDNTITLRLQDPSPELGDEGYTLNITPTRVTLTAANPAGIFYACQTLRQLLPTSIFSRVPLNDVAWTLPCVSIKDRPRFVWRGMHLDVARHFFDKEAIKRFLDLMALHKLNRFHWHLTDDQGWRIEILKYPKLTQIGAWRGEYGGYYSQEDLREIVDYAKKRYITIVPEIDVPGHTLAALAAYPNLACTEGPFKVAETWGIFQDVLCPCKEETFTFVKDVLTEVMGIFPSPYIHIGGDECPTSRWEASPLCKDFLKANGLDDVTALHGYFTRSVGNFLKSKGRSFIGWDEILEGGDLPDNAVIMSWRSTEGGIEGARRGHNVIMSPVSHCYFDFRQAATPDEPGAPLDWGITDVEKVYSYEPIPEELEGHPEQVARILGAQGNLWTERIPTLETLDYMALPRMSALAEVVWSARESRDWTSFSQRLQNHYQRLNHLGFHYRSSNGRPGLRLGL